MSVSAKRVLPPSCDGHPELVGGKSVNDTVAEMLADDEDIRPNHGKCFCFDDCVGFWQACDDPVSEMKSDGVYEFFCKTIEEETITSTGGPLYRGTNYYQTLNPGDVVDYSDRLSSWTTDLSTARDFVDAGKTIPGGGTILELSGPEAIKGWRFDEHRRGGEQEYILGRCRLRVDRRVDVDGYQHFLVTFA